jgi:tetratricopeptide (TPR) repeat protein
LAVQKGRKDDALRATVKAYEMGRQAGTEASVEFVATLNNLSVLYQDEGDYDAAEKLSGQAVHTLRGALRSQHPEAAQILCTYGNVLQAQGKDGQAAPLLKEAVELAKRALGPAHRVTATTLLSLAVLHQAQENYEDARALYREAATSLSYLADAHDSMDEKAEANLIGRLWPACCSTDTGLQAAALHPTHRRRT